MLCVSFKQTSKHTDENRDSGCVAGCDRRCSRWMDVIVVREGPWVGVGGLKQGAQSGRKPRMDAAVGDEYNKPDHIYLAPVYSPHNGRQGTGGAAGPDKGPTPQPQTPTRICFMFPR